MTGASDETGLPASWSQDGENLVWCNKTVSSRCTPILMNDRLFILADKGAGITEQERVVCLDAHTGALIWEFPVPVFHTTIPNTRVSWTSPAADPETGYVYCHTTGGLLLCLDRDGKLIWSHSLTEEYYRISGYGGRISNPVVDGDLVFLNFLNASWGDHAKGAHRFVAFDKRNGHVVWWTQPGDAPLDTNYCNPVIAEMHGMRLLVGGTADGYIFAAKVATGEVVWRHKFCKLAVNVSPVVDGNRVFVAHSEENLDTTIMGRVACIEATGDPNSPVREVWRVDGLGVGYASPAFSAGRLYLVDNSGIMFCLDAADGTQLWKHRIGRVGKGSPVVADGKIYCTEVNSRFVILKPGDSACETLDVEKFEGPDDVVIDVYGSPAVSNGRIYFATQAALYCIGSRDPRHTPNPGFVRPATAPRDAAVASIAIYPADVLLRSGEKQLFAVRAFDAAGRFIREIDDPTWSGGGLPQPLQGEFEFGVGENLGGSARVITAEAHGLKATARIRTLRPIPFAESFEKIEPGKIPPDWVGAAPKFTVDVVDGQHVLKKKADLPHLARGDVFIGDPNASGYTIQADVCGSHKDSNLPDMGITANRYRLELMGNTQKLRIVSWVPMPRIQVDMPFPWKEGEWFTLQMRVDMDHSTALVRGKVWKRGEPEPADWTITLEDPIGQDHGAPGIYGFSAADIYYDNISVWKSK